MSTPSESLDGRSIPPMPGFVASTLHNAKTVSADRSPREPRSPSQSQAGSHSACCTRLRESTRRFLSSQDAFRKIRQYVQSHAQGFYQVHVHHGWTTVCHWFVRCAPASYLLDTLFAAHGADHHTKPVSPRLPAYTSLLTPRS